MTADRYQNYRFVLTVLESDVFTPGERRTLVAGDRMRYSTAVELRARIDECGPDGVALSHA